MDSNFKDPNGALDYYLYHCRELYFAPRTILWFRSDAVGVWIKLTCRSML
jgi:hypothetical protein